MKKASKWQPIETAPKDGSLLLFYWPDVHNRPWQCERGYCLGFWSDSSIGDTFDEDAGWYDRDTAGQMLSPQPAYWASIPSWIIRRAEQETEDAGQ